MRLDKFLQVSRIIKRRSVANEICNRKKALVNDQPAKPSKKLKVGDILDIGLGSRGRLICEVLEVPDRNVPKNQASSLYKVISEIPAIVN